MAYLWYVRRDAANDNNDDEQDEHFYLHVTHTNTREHACRLKEFDEQIYFIRLISFID